MQKRLSFRDRGERNDRQTDRQTDRHKKREKEINRQTDELPRQWISPFFLQTDREKEINKQADGQTERRTDLHTER